MSGKKKTPLLKRPEILELDNHAKVSRILRLVGNQPNLGWYEDAVHEVVRKWFALGQYHLRIARALSSRPKEWRSVVSRGYYAAYNISRAVRYLTDGRVKYDASDHQVAPNLPSDFPDQATWANFLIDFRSDRNLADYEPWNDAFRKLSRRPDTSLDMATEFLRKARSYLRKRGMKI